ncbi:ubiquitin-conjugating enzyme E2 32-like [Zea mays]|uniref:Ubiquitin-conjugating enzyme E2 32 n=2 Tax=Zea mays TaxID=4577 RepID=A0A1D6K0D1_MAIZE|nr:ubiquitin-conjugating enzyme E2 32-like [Zea mays]ONL97266.1 Ubiquitin-conjugating enzyme E2 32 [Zea mays]|eukprot:NP_001334140.1 ubiquitin-conjugating enzyme E2 32-like [Zea mays]
METMAKYNRSNPAVKRILQEVKEMQSNPSPDFMALPLEEDIFEWQFAILGPRDSEFEGGIYHGRIQLPSDYPFKPPSFMLLTPSGRFEIQKKICLSISNYHPEHWQPSWSVRTALVALIAFMPTNPGGALGSLDYKKEDRRALGIKSREAPPKFGSPERQKLIDEIHEQMLSKAPPVPQTLPNVPNEESNELPASDPSGEHADKVDEGDNTSGSVSDSSSGLPVPESESGVTENTGETSAVEVANHHVPEASHRENIPRVSSSHQNPAVAIQKPNHDRLLTLAAFGLTLAIMALVIKKFLKINGLGGFIEGKF